MADREVGGKWLKAKSVGVRKMIETRLILDEARRGKKQEDML